MSESWLAQIVNYTILRHSSAESGFASASLFGTSWPWIIRRTAISTFLPLIVYGTGAREARATTNPKRSRRAWMAHSHVDVSAFFTRHPHSGHRPLTLPVRS